MSLRNRLCLTTNIRAYFRAKFRLFILIRIFFATPAVLGVSLGYSIALTWTIQSRDVLIKTKRTPAKIYDGLI